MDSSLIKNSEKDNKTEKINASDLLNKYAAKTYKSALMKYNNSLSEASYDLLLSELAESALSSSITGKNGANLNFIIIEIEESLTKEDSIKRLKDAELHYLESLESVRKFQEINAIEKLQDTSDIVRSIKLGISRFNIIFVIILICGLTWAAINLPKEALALVAAAIGGAITHLLSERQAVLSLQKESNGGCPRDKNE